MKFTYLFYSVLALLFVQCKTKEPTSIASAYHINTVTGPLKPDSMGITLIHEHILVDFIGADSTGYHRWDRDEVVERALPYLKEAKNYGVKTIIETTPAFLGRDPEILRRLSEMSGINIITNTGLYGAVNDKYLPQYAFEVDSDSLASLWISEYSTGIEDTGIRPGFMKISVDSDTILSPVDRKLVLAAIKTHQKTGITIVSHTGPDDPAFRQLELIEEAGISPAAWVWTHAQAGTDEGRIKAAKKGAWISLDNVMENNIDDYINYITALKNESLLHRVLISHDAGYYRPGEPDGGEFRGYNAIFTHLIPALKKAGFTKEDINLLLIKNPKEAYIQG